MRRLAWKWQRASRTSISDTANGLGAFAPRWERERERERETFRAESWRIHTLCNRVFNIYYTLEDTLEVLWERAMFIFQLAKVGRVSKKKKRKEKGKNDNGESVRRRCASNRAWIFVQKCMEFVKRSKCERVFAPVFVIAFTEEIQFRLAPLSGITRGT